MRKADLPRYSYAFHEAGHVFLAHQLCIPYIDARIEDTGGLGGAFKIDIDAINRKFGEKTGDLPFVQRTLSEVIYTLKGGEAVDRDLVRISESEVIMRSGGDAKIVEEILRPMWVDQLKLPEESFLSVLKHAGSECQRIITSPYVPLIISRVANLIYDKKIVVSAELNSLLDQMKS